jgi:CO/xanthine dehydrogenase Mo-binding subunit
MKLNTVGKNIIRVDSYSKVTGKALYPQDIYLENMLYAKTLRSESPHAYIEVDTTEAEKVDGVVKIFTHKDVPYNHHGVVLHDHNVFCDKKVRSIGDPIAFIVGESEEACIRSMKAIKVNYAEIPGVFDPVEAMKEDSPKVHDDKSNIIYHYKLRKGNVEEAFKNCAVIVENTYSTHMQEHAFLQPEAGLSYVDEDGTIVVVVATQYPHYDREIIARALNLKDEQVRIINTNIGGAFGAREDITMQIHLALASKTLNRPVKVIYNREESFLAHSKRHPMIMKYKTGADKDGYLMAMEAEIIGDSGAYCSWAINVLRKAGVHSTGPYVIPNVKVDSYAVYTNNPFTGAMRGFGATQVPNAAEQQMDILAEKLGISPIEIRRRNIFRVGSKTATGQVLLEGVPLDRCLETIAEKYEEFLELKEFGNLKAEEESI